MSGTRRFQRICTVPCFAIHRWLLHALQDTRLARCKRCHVGSAMPARPGVSLGNATAAKTSTLKERVPLQTGRSPKILP